MTELASTVTAVVDSLGMSPAPTVGCNLVIRDPERDEADRERRELGLDNGPAINRLMKRLSILECALDDADVYCYMGDRDSEHELDLVVSGWRERG